MPTSPPHTNAAPLGDWLAWLETLSPREIELGLERIATVLGRLDLPPAHRTVHIAGTNGKGSSAAMLEGLYRSRGYRVGCYTSPHVLQFNERIRIDGQPAHDDDVLAALRRVEAVRQGIPLTFFEYTTAAAMSAFAAANCNVLVLEVGLGGRLDAVNAITPDAALITTIGLDHCDWLGEDVETIAREKAGIMRRGKPVVFAADSMPRAIATAAMATGATLLQAGKDYTFQCGDTGWDWSGFGLTLDDLQPLSLRGEFQRANAAGALALFAALDGTDGLRSAWINDVFAGLRLPGRLQSFGQRWLLDVAHNPQAACALAAELGLREQRQGITAIAGALSNKDIDGILQPLLPMVDRWVTVQPEHARGLPAAQLAARIAALSNSPCHVAADIAEALAIARRIAEPEHCLLVTGSFFVVGPALEALSSDGQSDTMGEPDSA